MFKSKKFVAVVAMCMVALLAFSACGGEKKEASASGGSESSSASASSKNTSSSNALKANPASDFEYDFNEDGESLYIKRFIGKGKQIVFPAEIEGYPVTRITGGVKKDVFAERHSITGADLYKNTYVKSVVIPEGIEQIDGFDRCEALKSVTIPSTVKEIQHSAFSYCTSLTDVSIPASIETIDSSAFRDCPLTNLKISESITSMEIADSAFIGAQPPLAMRKRLQDLGYKGSF